MADKGVFSSDILVASYVKLIRSAEALHGAVSRGLATEGLSASQFSTLKVLAHRGPLAQRDIAKYILRTGGNVTVVVDNLERQGLVVRVRDTEDRRIIFVQLTEEGKELFDRVYPGHLERIRAQMGNLNLAECEQLVDLLEKLSALEEVPVCPDLRSGATAAPALAE